MTAASRSAAGGNSRTELRTSQTLRQALRDCTPRRRGAQPPLVSHRARGRTPTPRDPLLRSRRTGASSGRRRRVGGVHRAADGSTPRGRPVVAPGDARSVSCRALACTAGNTPASHRAVRHSGRTDRAAAFGGNTGTASKRPLTNLATSDDPNTEARAGRKSDLSDATLFRFNSAGKRFRNLTVAENQCARHAVACGDWVFGLRSCSESHSVKKRCKALLLNHLCESHRTGSNRRPPDYESGALPLSYCGDQCEDGRPTAW